jgi:predicted dehydrogenase
VSVPSPPAGSPRLGFLGVGWIGRHRLEGLVARGAGTVAAVGDASPEALEAACGVAPGAQPCGGLDALLDLDLDALVIATPSALHAEQAVRALDRGLAVFCQKPLGRDAAETARVVAAARRNDRLLGVDLSYRETRVARELRRRLGDGDVGRVFAAELVFHNAYGPDKDWFYDPRRAGGGCLVDLGLHLVDLLLWWLGPRAVGVEVVSSRLLTKGFPLEDRDTQVEDYAVACLELADGAAVSLACSWNLPAGREAVIEARLYGETGALEMSNVDGSFYDFRLTRHRGTARETLVEPPDPEWGSRALVAWARRLRTGAAFDPAVEDVVTVARLLDQIYAAHGAARRRERVR